MTTATVISCDGSGSGVAEQRTLRSPGPGEVLLALGTVGFCGTDLFKLDTGTATPGQVLGHEVVGTVVEHGADVEGFVVGDRMVVPHHVPCGTCASCRLGNETLCETFRENLIEPGAFASHMLVHARAVAEAAWRVPDALSDEAAVFLEPAACVLRGVARSGIADGSAACIQGAGAMGLLHLLVLRAARPASPVLVIDPVAERRELALELGAAGAAAPGDAALEAAGAFADGIDCVFDTVGGAGPLDAALSLTREGGTVVLFAHAPEGESATFDLNRVFKYERRILGSYSGSLAEQREIFQLLASGALDPRPLVSHRLALADFDRCVQLARKRQALKILLYPEAP